MYYWREEAKALEHQDTAKEFEDFQDQILAEVLYADPDSQATYSEYILSLGYGVGWNTWEKI